MAKFGENHDRKVVEILSGFVDKKPDARDSSTPPFCPGLVERCRQGHREFPFGNSQEFPAGIPGNFAKLAIGYFFPVISLSSFITIYNKH